jgi:hypothetical protein
MAAMTLPMVPPSFGYGRSDRRTPPESSVVRTTRGLKPSQTATPDQRREVHGHAAFRMVAQRYQPLRKRILSRSPTLRLAQLREPLAR